MRRKRASRATPERAADVAVGREAARYGRDVCLRMWCVRVHVRVRVRVRMWRCTSAVICAKGAMSGALVLCVAHHRLQRESRPAAGLPDGSAVRSAPRQMPSDGDPDADSHAEHRHAGGHCQAHHHLVHCLVCGRSVHELATAGCTALGRREASECAVRRCTEAGKAVLPGDDAAAAAVLSVRSMGVRVTIDGRVKGRSTASESAC